jgi:hypothetical protein
VARARLAALGLAAAAVAAAAVGVALDASRDRTALATADREVAAGLEALRSGDPAGAIARLRDAGAALGEAESGPAWRHAWLRLADADRLAAARASLDRAVTDATRVLESRNAFLGAVSRLLDRVARAERLSEIERIGTEAEGLRGMASSDAAAVERLSAALRARREAFDADLRRNHEAIDALRAALGRARTAGDHLAIMDSVLPAPPRRTEEADLRQLASRAADARARLVAARIDGLELEASDARDAAAARTLREGLERDPDLARPGSAELEARVRALREALRARDEALHAWEGTLRRAVAAVERADWQEAHDAAVDLRESSARWDRAAPGAGPAADAARARIDAQCDLGLYDALLRVPNIGSARAYLLGAPAHPRRMEGAVRAWLAAAEAAPLSVELASVRWAATGVPAPGTGLEDRPDAAVELRVEDAPWLRADFADVVEGTTTAAPAGVRCEWRATDEQLVRIGVRIRIDLRDAVAADPVAIGALAATAGALAGRGAVKIEARDPAWSGRPHEVLLRVGYAGVPSLPPYRAAADAAAGIR